MSRLAGARTPCNQRAHISYEATRRSLRASACSRHPIVAVVGALIGRGGEAAR
jgi:hypothetical protein